MKPDSILSGQARIDVLNRIKEVEALRDRTTILDDLDASVDSLSAQLKASIAAAKG